MNTEIIEFVKNAPIGALLTNVYGSAYQYANVVRVEGGVIAVARALNYDRNKWEDVQTSWAIRTELEIVNKSWAQECIKRTLKEGSFIKL